MVMCKLCLLIEGDFWQCSVSFYPIPHNIRAGSTRNRINLKSHFLSNRRALRSIMQTLHILTYEYGKPPALGSMSQLLHTEVDFLKTSQDVLVKRFSQTFWFKKSTKTFHNRDIYSNIWDMFCYFSVQQKVPRPKNVLVEGKTFLAHLCDWNIWIHEMFGQNVLERF